jgi:hypothetical protein
MIRSPWKLGCDLDRRKRDRIPEQADHNTRAIALTTPSFIGFIVTPHKSRSYHYLAISWNQLSVKSPPNLNYSYTYPISYDVEVRGHARSRSMEYKEPWYGIQEAVTKEAADLIIEDSEPSK